MNMDNFSVKQSFYLLGDLAKIFSDRTTVYQRSVPEKLTYVKNDKMKMIETTSDKKRIKSKKNNTYWYYLWRKPYLSCIHKKLRLIIH